jgi:hypothetical protein
LRAISNFSKVSYANSAYEIGLRPAFAILVGLRPDENFSEEEREFWYRLSPSYYLEDLVVDYSALLTRLWEERAEFERLASEKMMLQETKVS